MTEITPFLWFDDDAQEAVDLYSTLFDVKIIQRADYPDGAPMHGLMMATISIDGQEVMLLNAGPAFPQTEAFSWFVVVDTQAEIDKYWDGLIANGGEPSQCGWLKDPFGVSWQIVPRIHLEYMASPDREAAGRAMAAMMTMQKFDIAALEAAYAG